MLYLDHAATTPMRPEAREAMEPFLGEVFGNPSGLHGASRRAKNAMEEAREGIANAFGAEPHGVVFTSGGTESVNLGVKGPMLAAGAGSGAITTAVEHESVLASCAALQRLGFRSTVVGVDALGVVEPEDVAAAIDTSTRLVTVMAANNETGIVQPVSKAAAAARAVSDRVVVHTDAVQAVVSTPVRLDELDVDALSISGHKLGGPKGIGALVLRSGVDVEPVLHGGGQELGRRSGTANVAGIAGLAAAVEASLADRARFVATVGAERAAFESRLMERLPEAVVTGASAERLVQHSHVCIPGVAAETLLIRLDGMGLCASAGSACQSGALKTSHVLRAMGMGDETARGCVRFSFGWSTKEGEGLAAADLIAECVESLR